MPTCMLKQCVIVIACDLPTCHWYSLVLVLMFVDNILVFEEKCKYSHCVDQHALFSRVSFLKPKSWRVSTLLLSFLFGICIERFVLVDAFAFHLAFLSSVSSSSSSFSLFLLLLLVFVNKKFQ